MQYDVFGPFEVPRMSSFEMINFDAVKPSGFFWTEIEEVK